MVKYFHNFVSVMKFIIIFKEDKEIIELPASDVSLDQGFSGYTAIDDWERLDQMQLVPCRAFYNDDVFNAEILQVVRKVILYRYIQSKRIAMFYGFHEPGIPYCTLMIIINL